MHRWIRIVALSALAALVAGVACTSNSGSSSTPTTGSGGAATTAPAAADIATGASALRATLSTQLQEHVYLAGIATGAALQDGPTSPAFKAAAGALDLNSQDLAASVGSVYGDAAGKTFLALWRKHIGFFADYAVGLATKDKAMATKALKDLDGYRADFGAFLESATGGILSKDAVATELKGHVETLSAAIAAQAAGDPKAFDLLRTAAMHMPMTADVLAGAFVQQFPDKFSGSTEDPAAALRATLSTQLQEHVYLAG
ncbi:MAG: copper amine oxidase, partial [Actinomycetota bacterium]